MSKERKKDLKRIIHSAIGAEDPTVTVDTTIGQFVLQLATPRQNINIINRVSKELGGVNASLFSISTADYEYTRMIITLDTVIIEAPSEWKSAYDCYHEDVLKKLYSEYQELEASFRQPDRGGLRRSVSASEGGTSPNGILPNAQNRSKMEKANTDSENTTV